MAFHTRTTITHRKMVDHSVQVQTPNSTIKKLKLTASNILMKRILKRRRAHATVPEFILFECSEKKTKVRTFFSPICLWPRLVLTMAARMKYGAPLTKKRLGGRYYFSSIVGYRSGAARFAVWNTFLDVIFLITCLAVTKVECFLRIWHCLI